MTRLRRMRPMSMAAFGALILALSAILTRLAQVPPATAAIYRCALALPLLGALVAVERRRMPGRPLRARAAAFGAGALLAVQLVTWNHSIDYVGAGLATVLLNMQVVFVALMSWAVLHEQPSTRVVRALPLVLLGVLLVSGVLESGAYGNDPVKGGLFGLLGALMYGAFILVFRKLSADRPVAGPLLDLSIGGAVAAVPLAAVLGELELLPGWRAFGWLALLALSSQILSFVLIGSSLPRLRPAFGSLILTLQAAGAVLLAFLLLDEVPSVMQLIGVALILGGVLSGSSITARAKAGASS